MDILYELVQPLFGKNAWGIYGWAAVFFAIHVASRLFSGLFIPAYNRFSPQTKTSWDLSVVALLHAVAVGPLALYYYYVDTVEAESLTEMHAREIMEERGEGLGTADWLNAGSPRVTALLLVSSGYFVWDLTTCLLFPQGFGFLMHAFLGLLVFSQCAQPFMQRDAMFFLAFELSTPFLNIRNLQFALNQKGTLLFKINEVVFAVMFLTVRLCCGVPKSIDLYVRAWDAYHYDPRLRSRTVLVLFFTSNVLLMGLNFFWASKMLKMLKWRRSAPTTSSTTSGSLDPKRQ